MSSKRHSILPPVSSSGPKPPVHLSSSLTIADSAVLTGTHHISIHGDSVVHPRARFHSLTGRVTVGRRCIIHERATIGASPHSSSSSSRPTSVTSPLGTPLSPSSAAAVPGGAGGGGGAEGHAPSTGVTLGDYVTVEVGATIEAGGTVIGEGTVVGVGARVGAGAVVGKHCTLTPQSVVPPGEVVPDFTVILANGMRRTDRRGLADLKNKAMARQTEVLRKLIQSNPTKFQ